MAISLLKILNEIGFEKIYKVRGLLTTDPEARALNHILSDIRSILGITTVRVEELPNQDESGFSYKNILNIKIDPYPFIKSDKFSNAQSEEVVAYIKTEIQKIEGVKIIKFSSDIKIQDN